MEKTVCLIMAGGIGTRFWPRSRIRKPKQFLNIAGDDSLLEATIARFESISELQNIFIVSGKSQSALLEQQAKMLPKENIILEPVGRNTLPCIGLSATLQEKENSDSIMVVTPSDHLIENNSLFNETMMKAIRLADEKGGIVTIGITPTYPATGYGYIKTASELSSGDEIKSYKVDRFVEKPDEERAGKYLEEGGYFWNSGMFVFRISVFLEALKRYEPALYDDLQKIRESYGTSSFQEQLDLIYPDVKSISIDYGIMERADNIYLVEGKFNWNDLGSWESVYNVSEKDADSNVIIGEAQLVDTKNSYIYSDEGIVAVVGLDDVVVVRDGDAVLVCKRENAEDVKEVVEQLKSTNRLKFL